ncbi:hypothetical protein [Ornithinimicrobium murale]|uniref:hypothetical protein n=1 Tax=Ornithinimicrobium murale TaxID=1050153 RepID=UPI000E0D5D3E|nr:hypothetical protein [Ornithinimicrobium murale]
MKREVRVRPVSRTDIGGFGSTVIGVGLHPADGQLVVMCRAAQYAGGRFLGHLFLRLHEQVDGSWVSVHIPPKVAEFLGSAEPGTRAKVSGRWWTAVEFSRAPSLIVYK